MYSKLVNQWSLNLNFMTYFKLKFIGKLEVHTSQIQSNFIRGLSNQGTYYKSQII